MLTSSTYRSKITYVPYNRMYLNCYGLNDAAPALPYKAPSLPTTRRTPRIKGNLQLPTRIEPVIEYVADTTMIRAKIAALKVA